MLHFLLNAVLCVLVLMFIVPVLTRGAVAVPSGGLIRAIAAMVAIAMLNAALWFVISLFSLGGAILANLLTFGLVSLLVNALALWLTPKFAPSVLYVRSFGAAFGASFLITACAWILHALIG